MLKKLIASVLSVALLGSGLLVAGPSKAVLADSISDAKDYTYAKIGIFDHDYTSVGGATYLSVSSDGLTCTEVTESDTWNCAVLPGEGKIVLNSLNVTYDKANYKNSMAPIDFYGYTTAGDAAPLEIEVRGQNSITYGSYWGVGTLIHGTNLTIKGQPDANVLDLTITSPNISKAIYTGKFNSNSNEDDGSLTLNGLTLLVTMPETTVTDSTTFSGISTQGSFSAISSKYDFDGSKCIGTNHAIEAFYQNNSYGPSVALISSSMTFELSPLMNADAIYAHGSIQIYNSSIIGSMSDSASANGILHGLYAQKGEIAIANHSWIDIDIGGEKSDSYNAEEIYGMECRLLTISDSQVGMTLHGATTVVCGVYSGANYQSSLNVVSDSELHIYCKECIQNVPDSDYPYCCGIFAGGQFSFTGECDIDIQADSTRGVETRGLHFFGSYSKLDFNLTGYSVCTIYGKEYALSCPDISFTFSDHVDYMIYSEGEVLNYSYNKSFGICMSDDYTGRAYIGPDLSSLSLLPSLFDMPKDTQYYHVENHIYRSCEDDECLDPNCSHTRIPLHHDFEEGSDVCKNCGFLRAINITDLDTPSAGNALDKEVSSNLADQISLELTWSPDEEQAQAGADYTVTFKVTPKEGFFIDSTTTASINGETVALTVNDDGTAVFTKTYSIAKQTTPEPGPDTPTPEPQPDTPTPEPQPDTPTPEPQPDTPTPEPQPDTPTPTPEKEPSFEDFVERLYVVALGRPSEAEGKAFWVEQVVKNGFTGADCARFFMLGAPEFLGRNLTDDEFVEVLYKTYFDRDSEPDGKAYWLGRLASGTERAVLVEEFIESVEWCNVCATYGVKSGALYHKATIPSKNAVKFATRLYTCCLGRDPEEEGLQYWALALTNLDATGYQAASLFFTLPEFVGLKTTNEEYLTRLYTTFMGREPETDGFNYWLGLLNGGTDRVDVMKAFAGCPEFQEICNQYGIVRGEI